MANARGVILVAILLVLAVALWAGVYYGSGQGYNTNNGTIQNSPYNEFTAWVTVTEDPNNWNAVAYSKLVWGKNGVLQGWVLEGQVDYSQGGVNFRHVYSNGYVVFGTVESNGYFNISGCDSFNQQSILDTGYNTFIPEPFGPNVKKTLLANNCPSCNAWRLMLSGQTFFMLEQGGIPQWLQSWDKVIQVTNFVYNSKQYTAPLNVRTLPQCNPTNPGTIAYNNTVIPPGNSNEAILNPENIEQRLSEERELRQQEHLESQRKFKEPVAPVKLHSHVVDNKVLSGPLGKVQRVLYQMQLQAASNSSDDSTIHLDGPGATYCVASMKGDGYCDSACNNAANGWDSGDCCAGCCPLNKAYTCGSGGYNCLNGCSARPCLFLHGLGQSGNGIFSSKKPGGYPYFGHPSYWGPMESYLNGICSSYIYSYYNTNGYSWADPNLYLGYYNEAAAVNADNGVVFGHSMANPIMAGACLKAGLCSAKWYMIGGPMRGAQSASTESALYSVFGIGTNAGTLSLLSNAQYMGNDPNWSTRDQLSRNTNNRGLLKGALCGNRPWGGGGLSGAALYAVGALVYQGWVCTGSVWGVCYDWTLEGSDGLVGQSECQQYGYQSGSNWNTWYTMTGSWGSGSGDVFRMAAVNHYDETGNMGDVDGCVTWIKNMARRG